MDHVFYSPSFTSSHVEEFPNIIRQSDFLKHLIIFHMKSKNLKIFGIIIYLGRAVIGPPHGREGHGKGLTAVQGWFCPIEPSPALQAIIIKSKKQEPCMLKARLSKARTLHNHSNYQLSENKPKR